MKVTLSYLIIVGMMGWAHSAYALDTPVPGNDPDAWSKAIEDAFQKGGKPAVWALIPDNSDSFNAIMDNIQTGNAKWLKVADALWCCVDAGSADELKYSLAVAFTHAPETMLRRTDTANLKNICTDPLIEPSKAEDDEYMNALKDALKSVKDPALEDKKAECGKLIAAIPAWQPSGEQ